MSNAWKDHYLNEAQTHKMIFDQVSEAFRQHEQQWNLLNMETSHWTEKAEIIRWANEMARQSYATGYGYIVNMIEHLKTGNPFTAKKRMESFASDNRNIADWTKAAVAKWSAIATEYGVTLVDNENDVVEVALMADAALIDVYQYRGIKWNEQEADELSKKVLLKFQISDEDFLNWKKIRQVA